MHLMVEEESTKMLRFRLVRAQNNMMVQADKHRIEKKY